MNEERIQFTKDVEFGKRLKYHVTLVTSNIDHMALLIEKFAKGDLFPSKDEEKKEHDRGR